jgi:hypothetical protein
MTLNLLHSEFPYIRGKFDFLFYQCTVYDKLSALVIVSTYSVLLTGIGLHLDELFTWAEQVFDELLFVASQLLMSSSLGKSMYLMSSLPGV